MAKGGIHDGQPQQQRAFWTEKAAAGYFTLNEQGMLEVKDMPRRERPPRVKAQAKAARKQAKTSRKKNRQKK